MEFKSHATEFKADASKRILEGYAARFDNSDSYGDILRKGAFTKTVLERKDRIKVLYQHDRYQPIGRPLEAREDDAGLFTASRIAATPLGTDVLTLAAEGVLSELSIGFDTVKSATLENGGRELLEVRLWEWSPVTFAANELATITGVKSAEDLEPIIRNLAHLAPHGLKAGRVLSKENLERLKTALESIQDILAAAEPSDDTPKAAPKGEPQGDLHSVLEGIKSIRHQTAAHALSVELRAATMRLRGA